jgi:hypothetical protein
MTQAERDVIETLTEDESHWLNMLARVGTNLQVEALAKALRIIDQRDARIAELEAEKAGHGHLLNRIQERNARIVELEKTVSEQARLLAFFGSQKV